MVADGKKAWHKVDQLFTSTIVLAKISHEARAA